MENSNIRWQQRFSNYQKALSQLGKCVEKGADLNEMEEQGMIHVFVYTNELALNTIKDFYGKQEENELQGGLDAIQLANKGGLIKNSAAWMEMLKDKKLSAYAYNKQTAHKIVRNIIEKHFMNFVELKNEFLTM